MSWYTTIVVRGISEAGVRAAARRNGFGIEKQTNPNIDAALNSGEQSYLIVGDVSPPVGAVAQKPNAQPPDAWSPTRKARWLASKEQAAARRADRSAAGRFVFVELANDLAASGARTVGLLAHWYRSDFNQEELTFTRADVGADTALFGALREDELIVAHFGDRPVGD